ncbi:MAG: glycerol-3-phosphate 1-O-acyltransferase PlsY [Planctomycetota bacterium]|jgi:glycerol-3-phosphate acyltransferase PlsY
MLWPLSILGAYLVGSIPFGLIIGLSRGVDIRTAGSGNVGATNVGRLLGRRLGITCFVLDALKGAIPVLVAGSLAGVLGRHPLDAGAWSTGLVDQAPDSASAADLWLWLLVACAALLGHMFSPWLGFRGGKGVATGFGGMLAMWPVLTLPAAAALVVWLLVVAAFRYISLASVSAAISLPVTTLILAFARGAGDESTGTAHALERWAPALTITTLLAVLVAVRHRSNIARLRAGTEPKIGAASK